MRFEMSISNSSWDHYYKPYNGFSFLEIATKHGVSEKKSQMIKLGADLVTNIR